MTFPPRSPNPAYESARFEKAVMSLNNQTAEVLVDLHSTQQGEQYTRTSFYVKYGGVIFPHSIPILDYKTKRGSRYNVSETGEFTHISKYTLPLPLK